MKQDFIKAYTYAYGETKRKAEQIYREASPEYVAALVDNYKVEVRKAFYED